MTIYYSGTSGGFYDTDQHEYHSLPGDAVEITREERNDLLAGELSGLRITPGPGGLPVLSNPPEPTVTERAAQARSRRDRLLREHVDTLNPIRWLNMTAEQQGAWVIYRQALLDVPQQAGFPEDVVWPAPPTNGE